LVTGKFYGREAILVCSEHHVACAVVNGAETLDSDHGMLAGINANVPFSFEAPLTPSSPATITLLCDADREAAAVAVKLAAIQVQNLTQSSWPGHPDVA
jgi:hypothetical protein